MCTFNSNNNNNNIRNPIGNKKNFAIPLIEAPGLGTILCSKIYSTNQCIFVVLFCYYNKLEFNNMMLLYTHDY